MYGVLGKDMIEMETVPFIPKTKRGFAPKVPLAKIGNTILYKLKTGVQWNQFPVMPSFRRVAPQLAIGLLPLPEVLPSGRMEGLFLNADAGFDSKYFRRLCDKKEINANICFKKRKGKVDLVEYLDREPYQRYAGERPNALIDSYHSFINRYDTTVES